MIRHEPDQAFFEGFELPLATSRELGNVITKWIVV